MYVPSRFAMHNQADIMQFVRRYGFATLISADFQVTHLPLYLDENEGEFGTLYGHLARANPQAATLHHSTVLAIFTGPHAYISPRWYGKAPMVPTWNYAAVHGTGTVTVLDDTENARAMALLVAQYEPDLLQDEQLMPAEYQQKLRHAVVGFKIHMQQWQGKEKLGQHQPAPAQAGVWQQLQQSADPHSQLLAAYMAARNIGTGQ
ncbi:FMN-binding negative transcriptional regulator [Rheinheimera texasensis]|uniref:FMN-binding negative transcriptional regulator n=1 Tax=Rheinheimera texasensis TaxID=306205 RepID=UPI0004E171B7|nr:FMN-binding negative transcriptional regulator [Rheinheimera texasensis]